MGVLNELLSRLLCMAAPAARYLALHHGYDDDDDDEDDGDGHHAGAAAAAAAEHAPGAQLQQPPLQQQPRARVPPPPVVQDADALRLACHVFQLLLQDPTLARRDYDDDDADDYSLLEQQEEGCQGGLAGGLPALVALSQYVKSMCLFRGEGSVPERPTSHLMQGLPVLLYGLYRWDMPASRALGAGGLGAALQWLLAASFAGPYGTSCAQPPCCTRTGSLMAKLPLLLHGAMRLAEEAAAAAPRPGPGPGRDSGNAAVAALSGGLSGGQPAACDITDETQGIVAGVPAVGDVVAMACGFILDAAQLLEAILSVAGAYDYDSEDDRSRAREGWVRMLDDGCLAAVEACGRCAWASHAGLAVELLEGLEGLSRQLRIMLAYQRLHRQVVEAGLQVQQQ